MSATATPTVRGQCPNCLGTFTVKKDGTLHAHFAAVYQEADAWEAKRCTGSGEPPRPNRPLWR